MTDREFLCWLVNRLVHVYGESPNTDFVRRLHEIAMKQPRDQLRPAEQIGKRT